MYYILYILCTPSEEDTRYKKSTSNGQVRPTERVQLSAAAAAAAVVLKTIQFNSF
jgi:hypothetical protein